MSLGLTLTQKPDGTDLLVRVNSSHLTCSQRRTWLLLPWLPASRVLDTDQPGVPVCSVTDVWASVGAAVWQPAVLPWDMCKTDPPLPASACVLTCCPE